MFPTIKMGFQSDVKFAHKLWDCTDLELDTVNHIKRYPSYSGMREGLDLDCHQDFVMYFTKVINHRLNQDN